MVDIVSTISKKNRTSHEYDALSFFKKVKYNNRGTLLDTFKYYYDENGVPKPIES